MFGFTRSSFVVGVIFALALYAIAMMLIIIAVSTNSEPSDKPIFQKIENTRTYRTHNGIVLKFTSTSISDEKRVIQMIRSLRNVETGDISLLPQLTVIVHQGEMIFNTVGLMPLLPPGTYEYQRAFMYRPKWSISEKVVEYPPLVFKVCEGAEECKTEDSINK